MHTYPILGAQINKWISLSTVQASYISLSDFYYSPFFTILNLMIIIDLYIFIHFLYIFVFQKCIEFYFAGFFYWSLALSSLTITCLSGVLFVFVLPGVSWIFLDLQVNSSHQNLGSFQLLFLQIFSACFFLPLLLLKLHHSDVGKFDFVLWVTEALFTFLPPFFFLFFRYANIYWSIFSPLIL